MDKGGYKMKKLLFGTILLVLVLVFPILTMAAVDVGISISLPAIVFSAPPLMVVIPETNVYAVPDLRPLKNASFVIARRPKADEAIQ